MTGRFDPTPDQPYGKCRCGAELADRDAMHAHFKGNYESNPTHSVRIINPTRDERIDREVQQLADDALSNLCDDVWRLERDGVTTEELIEAAKNIDIMDLADALAEADE